MSPRCACANDRAWGILRGDRLHRVTFSRSLADYIVRQLGADYRLARLTFTTGAPIEPGEVSPTGLYTITTMKGRVLRVSLHREAAEMFRDESRSIRHCRIVSIQPVSEENRHVEEPRDQAAAQVQAA